MASEPSFPRIDVATLLRLLQEQAPRPDPASLLGQIREAAQRADASRTGPVDRVAHWLQRAADLGPTALAECELHLHREVADLDLVQLDALADTLAECWPDASRGRARIMRQLDARREVLRLVEEGALPGSLADLLLDLLRLDRSPAWSTPFADALAARRPRPDRQRIERALPRLQQRAPLLWQHIKRDLVALMDLLDDPQDARPSAKSAPETPR